MGLTPRQLLARLEPGEIVGWYGELMREERERLAAYAQAMRNGSAAAFGTLAAADFQRYLKSLAPPEPVPVTEATLQDMRMRGIPIDEAV